MNYRLGTKDDLDYICELIQDAIKTMESYGIYQWDELYPERADFESDIEAGNLYVVHEDDSMVAVYVISRECDEEYHECGWEGKDEEAYILHRFCVSPEYQNRGIGKMVLLHIEEQIRDMGCLSVRLDVFSQNPYALKLYRNNGYIERGFADWRKGRFYLMEKQL